MPILTLILIFILMRMLMRMPMFMLAGAAHYANILPDTRLRTVPADVVRMGLLCGVPFTAQSTLP